LFFNGNTFAELGRTLATAVFADLPTLRRKETASAVAHYITGVLDREAMTGIMHDLAKTAQFTVGARVKTMRGSLRGVITRVLDDGRVAVRPDGNASELLRCQRAFYPNIDALIWLIPQLQCRSLKS